MRNLSLPEVEEVGGGLQLLDDIAADIGKDLAEFANDVEHLYNGLKTRLIIASVFGGRG
jgi:hypothetical protein